MSRWPSTPTTPPDQTVWWDVDTVTEAVLDVLRLESGDVDDGRVRGLVPVAGARINDVLDRPDTDPVVVDVVTGTAPAPLVAAIVAVTVELYRQKDAPPTSVDGLIASAWRPPSVDPVASVRAMITPYRRRWGVG